MEEGDQPERPPAPGGPEGGDALPAVTTAAGSSGGPRSRPTWSLALWLVGLTAVGGLLAFLPGGGTGRFRAMVSAAGFWAPALFLILQASRAVTWLPGNVLTPLGGFVFGFWEGFLLSWLGVVLACAVGYEVARALGRDRLRRVLERRLPRLLPALERHGGKGVLVVRLLPGVPLAPVSLAAGVAGVPRLPYLLASAVGMVPRILLQTLVGVGAEAVGGD